MKTCKKDLRIYEIQISANEKKLDKILEVGFKILKDNGG
ncbi:unnamed protein product, partial [marine sediment metagenome]